MRFKALAHLKHRKSKAQKKQEILTELFNKWYTKVNAFENHLRPYPSQLDVLKHNQAVGYIRKINEPF
ncbi:MAG: hypothetical protein RSC55_00060, partial [Oscillospiraceae bacterium]